MSLSEEQQIQLRNTALEKASRLVMSGHCRPEDVYDVSRNFCDYMEVGVVPATWNIYQPLIGD